MASQDSAPGWSNEKAGLCFSCRFVRKVESSRGSIFYLCRRSEEDPAYERYPRLPVIQCSGFDPDPEITRK
jgi:hypothetical protein